MRTPNDVLVHNLSATQLMVQRFTADLQPHEYLHRPTEKANCAAWTVGHLALSDRHVLMQLGAELPPLPDGFDQRFSRAEGCPEAGDFGDVAGILPTFDEHRTRLIEAVKRATPEQLAKPLEKPHPMFKTLGELVSFMSAHTAMHVGQITIIRRSLGRPPLV
ncbi:MAG TPA: DinB family protein [Tepidisphaeraceae bacterium]|nr:DinB family protein [Tepidisphaeraceae bacterium]